MAGKYKFSKATFEEIRVARRRNKNKRAEARLKAPELRAAGKSNKERRGKATKKQEPLPGSI